MTDSEERRIAGILSQIDEKIEHRLPEHMPVKRPEWQIWTFLVVAVFYGGASWYQIEQNSEAISKHLETDAKRIAVVEANVESNKDTQVAHMQWELENAIELRDEKMAAMQKLLDERNK